MSEWRRTGPEAGGPRRWSSRNPAASQRNQRDAVISNESSAKTPTNKRNVSYKHVLEGSCFPADGLPAHYTPLQHPVRLLCARRTVTERSRRVIVVEYELRQSHGAENSPFQTWLCVLCMPASCS